MLKKIYFIFFFLNFFCYVKTSDCSSNLIEQTAGYTIGNIAANSVWQSIISEIGRNLKNFYKINFLKFRISKEIRKEADKYWPLVLKIITENENEETKKTNLNEKSKSTTVIHTIWVESFKEAIDNLHTTIEESRDIILNLALEIFVNNVLRDNVIKGLNDYTRLTSFVKSKQKPYLEWCWNMLSPKKKKEILKKNSAILESAWYRRAENISNELSLNDRKTLETWFDKILEDINIKIVENVYTNHPENCLTEDEKQELKEVFVHLANAAIEQNKELDILINAEQILSVTISAFSEYIKKQVERKLIYPYVYKQLQKYINNKLWAKISGRPDKVYKFNKIWKNLKKYLENNAEESLYTKRNLDYLEKYLIECIMNDDVDDTLIEDSMDSDVIYLRKYMKFLSMIKEQVESNVLSLKILDLCNKFLICEKGKKLFGPHAHDYYDEMNDEIILLQSGSNENNPLWEKDDNNQYVYGENYPEKHEENYNHNDEENYNYNDEENYNYNDEENYNYNDEENYNYNDEENYNNNDEENYNHNGEENYNTEEEEINRKNKKSNIHADDDYYNDAETEADEELYH